MCTHKQSCGTHICFLFESHVSASRWVLTLMMMMTMMIDLQTLRSMWNNCRPWFHYSIGWIVDENTTHMTHTRKKWGEQHNAGRTQAALDRRGYPYGSGWTIMRMHDGDIQKKTETVFVLSDSKRLVWYGRRGKCPGQTSALWSLHIARDFDIGHWKR